MARYETKLVPSRIRITRTEASEIVAFNVDVDDVPKIVGALLYHWFASHPRPTNWGFPWGSVSVDWGTEEGGTEVVAVATIAPNVPEPDKED